MSSTIAAISTGSAPGGIGVIRISGKDALSVAQKVFFAADGSNLCDLGGYRAKYGFVVANGKKSDNAVALVFRAPKSYTGENVVEISVHGGLLIVQKTLRAVLDAGAVPAGPGEFTKRAFLNGKIDLTQAEAVAGMISAQGEDAAAAAYSAMSGSLSAKINFVLQKLLDTSALLAAWVDYPDEEIPEIQDSELKSILSECIGLLEKLLNGYDSGQAITNGIPTVIAGKANVGKSSLMNMLTGKDRSIVTHIEGTTRDIICESVNVDGITLKLSDTAGLRHSNNLVENIGIEKSRKAVADASLVLAVFDSSRPLDEQDEALIELCKSKRALAVLNKTDLDEKADAQRLERSFSHIVRISAKQQTGAQDLASKIKQILGVADFDSSAPMLANERQKQNCQNALDNLHSALDGLEEGITLDAVNVMIDGAADELLSLTGKKATTEVVNTIFSKFCVGK